MDASKASTLSVDEISETLKKIGLDTVPQQPNTYPALNPFDILRSHITELLSKQTGIDSAIIYRTLAWTAKPENGDLQLAIPALRQKGKDMKELAKEIGEQVRCGCEFACADMERVKSSTDRNCTVP
jgi:arginyl-tRNA synthetase